MVEFKKWDIRHKLKVNDNLSVHNLPIHYDNFSVYNFSHGALTRRTVVIFNTTYSGNSLDHSLTQESFETNCLIRSEAFELSFTYLTT